MRGILRMTVLAAAVFGVAGNALAEDWKLAKDEDGVDRKSTRLNSSHHS